MHHGAAGHVDLFAWPGLILTVFTIVVMLATAIAISRATYTKGQIEALRGDRDDLGKRVELLEKEMERKTSELKTANAKVQILENMVTGREMIIDLKTQVAEYFAEDKEHRKHVDESLSALLTIDKSLNTLVKVMQGGGSM